MDQPQPVGEQRGHGTRYPTKSFFGTPRTVHHLNDVGEDSPERIWCDYDSGSTASQGGPDLQSPGMGSTSSQGGPDISGEQLNASHRRPPHTKQEVSPTSHSLPGDAPAQVSSMRGKHRDPRKILTQDQAHVEFD